MFVPQIYEFFLIPCKRMDENVRIYSFFWKKVEIIGQAIQLRRGRITGSILICAGLCEL